MQLHTIRGWLDTDELQTMLRVARAVFRMHIRFYLWILMGLPERLTEANMGLVFKWLYYGSTYYGLDDTTGPFMHFLPFWAKEFRSTSVYSLVALV